jgi:predicted AlkP superfamily phosphohydrolase/phosphomutase
VDTKRRQGRRTLKGFCLLGLIALLSSCASPGSASASKKLLILGLDGLDPQITTRLMDEGKLPNFSRLRSNGSFSPLATSIPPESPVAWSTFLTGLDAGGHGIFDFIHRDPATMVPYLSTTTTQAPGWNLPLGRWRIPLWQGDIQLNRKGRAFWEILEDHGVPCTIVRIPANYPPTHSRARQLAGMGTPDLEGTYGTFSFYTDEPAGSYGDVAGGRVFYVRVRRDRVEAELPGPDNSFERDSPRLSIPFTVLIDASNPVAKVIIQERQVLLKPGEWSEWVPVRFEMLPLGMVSAAGIVRFYLKEIRPDFKLYVSPVNVDPSDPVLPISEPAGYAPELQENVGRFSTLGIPEDTKALSGGILDRAEFLAQSRLLREEETRLLDYQLEHFKSGVLFFYSGRADQLQHMFWREMETGDREFGDTIEKVYQDMDSLVGCAVSQVDSRTVVIALSDHGFAGFSRAFSLNNWLEQQGYAARQRQAGSGYLEPFDWARTRAYGLGFTGLYVNEKGREKNGWVQPAARDALLDEIQKKLLEIRDPVNGKPVVTHVYRADCVYSGAEVAKGPDLIVGYNRGYRASWESVLGLFSAEVLADNTDQWSGDHLMDPALVPGILFANRPIQASKPGLLDLAPTILKEFGVEKDADMKGNPVF